jgi:hypothetical protein
LAVLARDKDEMTVWKVYLNVKIPFDILAVLGENLDNYIRKNAIRTIRTINKNLSINESLER